MSKINNKINRIYKTDTIEVKFNKFLATKHVNSFVNDIPYLGIDNLLKKYNLQYLYKISISKAMIMAYIRLKTANIRGIRDYTHLPKQDYITTLPKSLTKEEIQKYGMRRKIIS